MAADLVIAGGTVVLPDGPVEADVVVADERIVAITEPGAGRGARVIEARDRIVLPGGVDGHVHFLIGFMGQRSVYDFALGTQAALRGGVTTVIDFALQRRGRSLMDGLKHRRVQADRHVATDYGLHLIVTDPHPGALREIEAVKAAGATSFKVYMVYEKEQLRVDDGPLLALMHEAGRHDVLVGLHAENASIIDYATARHVAAGEVAPRFHAITRPAIAETEAVQRALLLAEAADCPVHIFHLASGPGCDAVAAARRRGQRASAETCTHYLAHTEEAYQREDGHLYVMSPPLRDRGHQERLWRGLAEGDIAAVTSDDASYSAEAKRLGSASFETIANGVPGVEARLPVLYTLGVASGRLTLARFVDLWSAGPARLFGLAPNKGAIRVGADADLVVIDPGTPRRMTAEDNFGPIGYSPYAGMELVGWPTVTLRRGTVVMEDGRVLARPGEGRYLVRGTCDAGIAGA